MKKERNYRVLILVTIWLVGAVCDRLWFALDESVPAWDQADYLTGALNYWQALQSPEWFSSQWWTSLWQLSSKIPPGTYLATAVVHNLFGTQGDRATLINLLFSAILLASVYGLGKQLFNPKVGLWAAGLCLLFPGLYQVRLDFLLDYPLTAVVTLSFYCLTLWKSTEKSEVKSQNSAATGQNLEGRNLTNFDFNFLPYKLHRFTFNQWFWAVAFGLSLALALMVKQTALLFLLTPMLWLFGSTIRRRNWERLTQLIGAGLLSLAVIYPWYRTNWLLVLTGSKRATVDAAIAEGDPPLTTLFAWTFYLEQLPNHVSFILLIVPILGLIIYGWDYQFKGQKLGLESDKKSFRWLAIFWVGSYLLCSLNINKDFRYVLPYLPVVAIALAYGLTLFPRKWERFVGWGTCSAAILLMVVNLWPIAELPKPEPGKHHAYRGGQWQHEAAIAEIIETSPYLRSTLGVLPSTPTINQHNFNYYGALANFQVYGRQVGTRRSHVLQDARSLDWFVTKTGAQGSVPVEAQAAIVREVEQGEDFELHASWPLPDDSTLKLYHRKLPSVQVEAIARSPQINQIALDRVLVPLQSPPGVPVPVTYEWSGNWEQLRDGIVLLTWQLKNGKTLGDAQNSSLRDRWFHDRGIGMGALHFEAEPLSAKVLERTAMLPPPDVATGNYTLVATYLNRKTGESYPIAVPSVTLKIDPAAAPSPAPELDLVTQLRSLSRALPQGPDALGPVFDEIGRINQYDPIQDYLDRAERSLEYRLQEEPNNLEFAYNLALTEVLQRDANGAIAALKRVVQLDLENPYAHAYLAFVNLYDWRPRQADLALKPAIAIAPNLLEVKLLSGVASLMQGNLVQTWNRLHGFIPPQIQTVILTIVIVIVVLLFAVPLLLAMKYRIALKK